MWKGDYVCTYLPNVAEALEYSTDMPDGSNSSLFLQKPMGFLDCMHFGADLVFDICALCSIKSAAGTEQINNNDGHDSV